jgi:glycosyltransferase involved in cell wall biosynthesis
LWDHPYFGDMISFPDGKAVRDAIRYADNKFIPEAKAVYANSRNVAQRLKAANGLLARPLYHPPENADAFYGHEAEDFMFFPSRITRLKRQDLVISALAHCHEKVRIVFAGAFEDPDYKSELQRLADRLGVGHQVIWKGFVSDEEKRDLYARCTATVYPPLDEDYGYITLEAMLSRKAVITAIDSGGPLEFVIDGETGFVVDAEPIALGEVMDKLWSDRSLAARMGQAGAAFYHSNQISWDHVVDVLTA